MSETASLLIRDRGLKSSRVVVLSGDHVRVGRSPMCDVLLLDPKLARVECHLTREAGRWTLTPERSDGRVWFQGSRLAGPLLLEESHSFMVGENVLTFRSGAIAGEAAEHVDEPSTPVVESPVPPLAAVAEPLKPEVVPTSAARRSEWNPGADRHQHLLQSRAETRKWESRWRAVGEKLKETSVSAASAPRPVGTGVSSPTAHRRPAVTPSEPPRVPPPAVAPVARIVERPLPSASRVTRESRSTPLHARSTIAPPPLRPEVSPPIPVARPSYASPRPASAPSNATTERVRPRTTATLAPAPSYRVAEPPVTVHAELLEKPFAVEIPSSVEERPVESRQAERVLESFLSDVDEENRENEAPPRRTLGATRRVGSPPRKPSAQPKPRSVSTPEPILETTPETEWNPVPLAALLRDAIAAAVEAPASTVDSEESVTVRHEEPPLQEEELLRPETVPSEVEHTQHAFVTDTFPREPLVWRESTAASAPFDMAEEAPPRRTSTEEAPPVDPSESGTRHDRFRRSPLDQEQARGVRRDPSSSQDWPSVSDIFINRPPSREEPAAGRVKSRRAAAVHSRPEPTLCREPAQWSIPVWLGWFPATAASLFFVAALVGLNWYWTIDNYQVGMVARRLDPKSGLTTPLPEEIEPGPVQWWRTSANHLLTWARYLDRAENDPAKQAESRELLVKASEISPLSPTVRHAAAIAASDPTQADRFALAKAVGQSRDILTLTHAGGQLLKAGKQDSARDAYRMALEMACKTGVDQPISPVLDGAQIRYSLPTEDLLVPVIRDMVSQKNWGFADWQAAIPRRTVAPLVAARVLQEMRHRDAKAALELARSDAISETLIAGANRAENTVSAVLLAAEAEALAMDDKLKESLECYRAAIERMPIDRVARSWWLNLAEIARRLNHDSDRRKALELAKCDDPKDEITAQAIQLQKEAGDFLGQTAEKAKRDPETRAASTTVE